MLKHHHSSSSASASNKFKQLAHQLLTQYPYLSKQAKHNIHQYHYVSSDGSFLSRQLNPFWEYCANHMLPRHMAPNTVTLLGFLGVLLAFFVTVWLNPHLDRAMHPFIYLFNALCMFFYQTMDAIDGKHARNIKAGSVLGELFDHGIDAIVTILMAIVACATFQSGATYSTVLVIIMLYLASFLIIWEDYLTDTLRFGMFNGPTEGILCVVAVLVLTAVFGPGIWTYSLLGFDSNSRWPLSLLGWSVDIRVNTLFVLLFCIGSISAVTEAVKMVRSVSVRRPPLERFKTIGGMDGARQSLVPFVTQLVLYAIYAWNAPNIVHGHIISMVMVFGLSSAYMQTRLVFARATKERTPQWYLIQLPMLFVALSALHLKYGSLLLHYSYLLYICVVYLHFAYNGIVELTKVLGIEAFSVKKHHPVPDGFQEIKWRSESSA